MNIKSVLYFAFWLSISACQSIEKAGDRWLVTDRQGRETVSISDEIQIETLNSQWEKKQPVKVKMMPRFNFELHIYRNGKLSEWLYSDSGYAMLKDSAKLIIYKTELASLNLLIEK